jgi:hypothetical protein
MRVEGEPDLIKSDAGIVQNVNHTEYWAFVNKRKSIQESNKRMDLLEQDNREIKNSLAMIIKMLGDKK